MKNKLLIILLASCVMVQARQPNKPEEKTPITRSVLRSAMRALLYKNFEENPEEYVSQLDNVMERLSQIGDVTHLITAIKKIVALHIQMKRIEMILFCYKS